MSKIGRQPVKLPEGVTAEVSGQTVKVTGPKGALTIELPRGVSAEVKEGSILVSVKGKSISANSMHGTFRSILASNVKGVSEGWSKQLELVGTGFRAEVAGRLLTLTVGFSHPVKLEAPEGINFKVEKTIITIDGTDKELVGRVAAGIRAVRPPEPYKGKGIKYVDEFIRRKPGKAAAKATVGGAA